MIRMLNAQCKTPNAIVCYTLSVRRFALSVQHFTVLWSFISSKEKAVVSLIHPFYCYFITGTIFGANIMIVIKDNSYFSF